MTEILFTSGAVAALIAAVGLIINEALKLYMQRRGAVKDKELAKKDRSINNSERLDDISNKLVEMSKSLDNIHDNLEGIKFSNRVILFDRIKYLSMSYIRDKEISFEDRQNLHNMHKAYHDYAEGNGDLDLLMQAVNELPLKRPE